MLEILSTEPCTASELARRFGVDRSTSLRFLQELHSAGYLRRDEQSKRFMTSPDRFHRFIASDPSFLEDEADAPDLVELVSPILARLREDSGEAAILGVPANTVMVYMAYVPSSHAVAVRERIATVRPMHASALGKAYLSALDEQAFDLELGRLSYRGGTELAAKGPLELRARVEEVRRRGFAVDRDESLAGVSCVAAPVFVGVLVGAVGVSGPSSRLTDDVVSDLGSKLMLEVASLAETTVGRH